MQPMQPMGGPSPMGGPPSGMRPVVRQGTPKAVPVIVSAGLAVGVFCGLLFGLGTGDEVQAAAGSGEKKFVSTKIDGTEDTPPQAGSFVTPPKSVTSGTPTAQVGSGSAAQAGSGSAAGSAATPTITAGSADAGSAAGAGSAEPAAKTAKLTVEIKPDKIASTATITVDDAEVTGGTYEVPLGDATHKEVKVVVKASGYKDVEQKVEVEGDTTLKIELVKRSRGGGLRRPPPPGGSGKKKKPSGGGGLIDI